MQEALTRLEERDFIDYDMDAKIEVFANLGIILMRILKGKQQKSEVATICGSLLEKNL